jgi:hypothetical protein
MASADVDAALSCYGGISIVQHGNATQLDFKDFRAVSRAEFPPQALSDLAHSRATTGRKNLSAKTLQRL